MVAADRGVDVVVKGCGRSARGASGGAVRVERVARVAEGACVAAAGGGEVVHVGRPDDLCAGAEKAGRHHAVAARHERSEHRRTAGQGNARDRDRVLYADPHTCKRTVELRTNPAPANRGVVGIVDGRRRHPGVAVRGEHLRPDVRQAVELVERVREPLVRLWNSASSRSSREKCQSSASRGSSAGSARRIMTQRGSRQPEKPRRISSEQRRLLRLAERRPLHAPDLEAGVKQRE